MTSESTSKDDSFVINQAEIEFVVSTPAYCEDREARINVPIPLPEYTFIEDYLGKLRSQPSGKFLDYKDTKEKLRKFVYDETVKYENRQVALAYKKERDSTVMYQIPKKPEVRRKTTVPFEEKFKYVVKHSSSENLLTLMRMEVFMKKQMTDMIRARNWEVDQLAKQCEKLVAETGDPDMHPHKISMLNEKLRQVHTTYSFQVADLSDSQKAKYRKAVDSLYTRGSIPAEFLDDVVLDDHTIPRPIEPTERVDGVNESFTIYIAIGSQLKSMHNMCLVTVDRLTDLCQTLEGDWTTSSRLEMATNLYSRNLSATTLLVPRDPMMHINSSSDFFKICEQSTDLHFDTLAEQLKKVAKRNKERNTWKADRIDEEAAKHQSEGKEPPEQPVPSSALRQDSTCSVGDVYITKHSNLHKVQIVYHLVVDETLQSTEINSRHPCLAGVRNLIRTAARYNTNTIHIPLLLIDRPDESTTIYWCLKRAEMLFKCVKGYLMEVCSGMDVDSLPHYNVHFVLPSGLAPTIYSAITTMFPTIFHLVPGVSS